MKRFVAATAVAGITLGAAALAVPATASAATHAPIRSYTESSRVDISGTGAWKGWYYRSGGTEKVELAPRLAFDSSGWLSGFNSKGRHMSSTFSDNLVGRTEYYRYGGSWKELRHSAAQLRAASHALSPYTALAWFDATRGVKQVGAGVYEVTGNGQQVGAFLSKELRISSATLSGDRIKTVTIDFRVGPAGRPLEITVSGRSAVAHLSAVETFGNYNVPLTITPKA